MVLRFRHVQHIVYACFRPHVGDIVSEVAVEYFLAVTTLTTDGSLKPDV
jgi:hypothetical protein